MANPLQVLTDDHRLICSLLFSVTESHGAARRRILKEVDALLRSHLAAEHEVLEPLRCNDGDVVRTPRMAQILAALDAMDAEDEDAVAQLVDAVVAHADVQEDVIFPFLHRHCDPSRLSEAGLHVARVRNDHLFERRGVMSLMAH